MGYNGHPLTDPRDAVRHIVGDKDNLDLLLTDEEIDYHLNQSDGEVLLAAADCAEAIAALPRMQQPQAGDSGGTPVTRADYYLKLARQLRSRAEQEEAEAEESLVASPGVSLEALHREPLFKRGVGL
jgi:hypothetical protein